MPTMVMRWILADMGAGEDPHSSKDLRLQQRSQKGLVRTASLEELIDNILTEDKVKNRKVDILRDERARVPTFFWTTNLHRNVEKNKKADFRSDTSHIRSNGNWPHALTMELQTCSWFRNNPDNPDWHIHWIPLINVTKPWRNRTNERALLQVRTLELVLPPSQL